MMIPKALLPPHAQRITTTAPTNSYQKLFVALILRTLKPDPLEALASHGVHRMEQVSGMTCRVGFAGPLCLQLLLWLLIPVVGLAAPEDLRRRVQCASPRSELHEGRLFGSSVGSALYGGFM